MRGSLRERRPGVWELRVSIGADPVTGQRRSIARTYNGGKRAAQKALAELVTEVAAGRHHGTDATLADLLAAWLDHIEPDRSPTTMHGYRRRATRRIDPALGPIPVRKLRASDLDGYYRQLRQQGRAPADIRQDHAIIRGALGQAVKWGWAGENVATKASPPKLHRAEIVPPTPLVVRALIAAAEAGTGHPNSPPNGPLGLFLRLAAVTGARRGELCALALGDVDLELGTLTVRRSVIEVDGALVVKGTKTHAARRVSLDADTVLAVAARVATIGKLAAELGATPEAGWFLFSHAPGGEPWRPEYVTLMFGRLTRRLGAKVRLHDLRHANATQLLGAGVDVRTVAGRLGHAQPSTTLNIYAHFLEQPDRAAAELSARILDD